MIALITLVTSIITRAVLARNLQQLEGFCRRDPATFHQNPGSLPDDLMALDCMLEAVLAFGGESLADQPIHCEGEPLGEQVGDDHSVDTDRARCGELDPRTARSACALRHQQDPWTVARHIRARVSRQPRRDPRRQGQNGLVAGNEVGVRVGAELDRALAAEQSCESMLGYAQQCHQIGCRGEVATYLSSCRASSTRGLAGVTVHWSPMRRARRKEASEQTLDRYSPGRGCKW